MERVIDILHLHGFKCAGTTFTWILEKNFPGQVAYVEARGRGDRLAWQDVSSRLDLSPYRALTSHLITLPEAGKGPARMNIAFVRDARERIESAYRFHRKTNSLAHSDETFAQFVERIETSALANYQTRHLSPQDDGGWDKRRGWQLRPDLIQFDRDDLFIGVVERFDESLIVIERLLAAAQITFDAAYPSAMNKSETGERFSGIPISAVELDDVLHDRAVTQLEHWMTNLAITERTVREFRERCASLTKSNTDVSLMTPDQWTYLD